LEACTFSRRATVVPAHGARSVQAAAVRGGAAFDCFYVYPTVSTEDADNRSTPTRRFETGPW